MISVVRCLQRSRTQFSSSWLKTRSRFFHLSATRFSEDIFRIQDEDDFQKQVIDSKKPFLVDFQASWCGPCKILEPRLERLITNYNANLQSSGDQRITLAKVDIDQMEELTGKYKIEAVPTVVAIKNGREIGRFTGLIDEDRIETMLDRLNR